jgi:hypothetical protein
MPPSQPVDMRRLHLRPFVQADRVPPLVVRENEDDVRAVRGGSYGDKAVGDEATATAWLCRCS